MRIVPTPVPALPTLAFALVTALAPEARASCGAENCPLDITAFGGRARRLSFEVSYQYVDQQDVQTGLQKTDPSLAFEQGGEVRTTSNTTTAKALLSVGSRMLVTASIPYINRFHSHVVAGDLPVPELREWTFSGPGDLTLMGNGTVWGAPESSPFTLSLQAGIKLPTGRDHIPTIDGEEPEPHVRPGTGSTDALAGFQILTRATIGGTALPTLMFASGLYTHTGVGVEGYRIGRMLEGHLGASVPVYDRLRAQLQVNGQIRDEDRSETPDAEGGHVGHEIPGEGASTGESGVHENTGGSAVFLAPGLRYEITDLIALSSYVQLPVYLNVNGTQLVAPMQFWIGTTWKLP